MLIFNKMHFHSLRNSVTSTSYFYFYFRSISILSAEKILENTDIVQKLMK